VPLAPAFLTVCCTVHVARVLRELIPAQLFGNECCSHPRAPETWVQRMMDQLVGGTLMIDGFVLDEQDNSVIEFTVEQRGLVELQWP